MTKIVMSPVKRPRIVLEDVHYTGELRGFGEQHDDPYRREAWLQRLEPLVNGDRAP